MNVYLLQHEVAQVFTLYSITSLRWLDPKSGKKNGPMDFFQIFRVFLYRFQEDVCKVSTSRNDGNSLFSTAGKMTEIAIF